MTAATIRTNLSSYRYLYALVAVVAALLIAVALLEGRAADAQGIAAPAPIAPERAMALVEATSSVAAVKAVGEEAKLINAAMPFDAAPVPSARPFAAPTEGSDHQRAMLCLTQAVYYEAGFEPMTGRRAVAQVVLNRARHPAYPKSVCGVVYQKNSTPVCQFSFVCDGSLYRQPAAGAWAQARAIAAAALAGYVEPSVGSATHYHADYVAPRWAPMLSKVAKLGAHIFYRWQGAWGLPGAFTGRYIGEPADPMSLRPALRRAITDVPDTMLVGGEPAYAGPPIARAPNDVGGLLDTSKGWTLNIPMPSETGAATRSIAAAQQDKAAAKVAAPAETATPIAVIAAR